MCEILEAANLHTPEIESLLNSILELSKGRNLVAHNPIASSDEQGTDSYVLVVRHKTFPPEMDKLDCARLEAIAERLRAALAEFLRLLPGARQFEPHSQ